MQAKLVVVGGETKTTEVALRLPTVIGRGRGVSLLLPHPLVSRRHCEIYEDAGRLMVRDLGSLNGTFVGKERIEETAPLPPGELLTIGTVTFRAVYGQQQTDIAPPETEGKAEETLAEKKPAPNSAARAEPPTEQVEPSQAGEENRRNEPLDEIDFADFDDENETPAAEKTLDDEEPNPAKAADEKPEKANASTDAPGDDEPADDDDDDLNAFLRGL